MSHGVIDTEESWPRVDVNDMASLKSIKRNIVIPELLYENLVLKSSYLKQTFWLSDVIDTAESKIWFFTNIFTKFKPYSKMLDNLPIKGPDQMGWVSEKIGGKNLVTLSLLIRQWTILIWTAYLKRQLLPIYRTLKSSFHILMATSSWFTSCTLLITALIDAKNVSLYCTRYSSCSLIEAYRGI